MSFEKVVLLVSVLKINEFLYYSLSDFFFILYLLTHKKNWDMITVISAINVKGHLILKFSIEIMHYVRFVK